MKQENSPSAEGQFRLRAVSVGQAILREELLQKGWWGAQGPRGPGKDDYDLHIRGAGVRTHMNRRRGPAYRHPWRPCLGSGALGMG